MNKSYETSPERDSFGMPGEFEPHEKCWMLWPERADTWRLNAQPAQKCFTQVAQAISQFEPVVMGVSRGQLENAKKMLSADITIVEIASNDSWMRDVGPTFVKHANGGIRGVDWGFNAWGGLQGGLYYPWDKDEKVAQKVLYEENIGRYVAPFILEGGSIHVDGEGTLITTTECLLNPNRNPDLSLGDIEYGLKVYLGINKVIWLSKGVYNDETDGHVDNLCCFIRPGVVLLLWTDDPSDPQHAISQDAFYKLSKAVDAKGRTFEIHKIHQPGPLYMTAEESSGVDPAHHTIPRNDGNRLAGSYVNFYIANNGVVMPLFDDPYDKAALNKIRSLFPERKVVGIPAREILLGGGNIHCITQQQPK
jgi:agmatine deiminase